MDDGIADSECTEVFHQGAIRRKLVELYKQVRNTDIIVNCIVIILNIYLFIALYSSLVIHSSLLIVNLYNEKKSEITPSLRAQQKIKDAISHWMNQ